MRLRHPDGTGPARERRPRAGRRVSVPPMDLPGQEPADDPDRPEPAEPATEPPQEPVLC
ncbi:hypothetical protein [Nonomuraea africana]|uniref:Uncharacterized protein n=1 Tax=Nonomuraea africana TaxID=46171 RepID=A0ABR9KQE0_9ACTN|nr:hypothetical protein [Nonomuraea africana]MBE1564242.1 hypothetical protein [Nonomuraea africana]